MNAVRMAVVGRPFVRAWAGLAAAPQRPLIEAFTAEAHVSRMVRERMKRTLAILALILPLAVACQTRSGTLVRRFPLTSYTFSELRAGIAHHAQTSGTLPDSLGALCSAPGPACPWRNPGVEILDGWGRRIAYRRLDGEFELRSWGADGVEASADDIVFRPSVERATVTRLAGCYRVALPWWKDYPEDWLELLPDSTGIGEFHLWPDEFGFFRMASWQPISPDSIVVSWVSQHYSREFHLRVFPDSLVGVASQGVGFARGREPAFRRRRVVAHRGCPA